MKFRTALTLATVLATPVAAMAQPIDGLYIGAGVGGSFSQNQGIDRSHTGGIGGRIRNDFGPLGVASVGFGFGNGIRLEVQGDYRTNKLVRAGAFAAGGDERQFGGFVNALYDLDVGNSLLGFTPYVGAGVGYEQVAFANGHAYTAARGRSAYIRSTSTDGNFAVQGIIGASYPIASVPGLSATVDYRFTAIPEDLHFKTQVFSGNLHGGLNGATSGAYEHAFTIGARYAFGGGAQAPVESAPMAVPTPAALRTFLVFFDWDRSDLTERARTIVAEAAGKSSGVTRIDVQGHTDASGKAEYNQALSVRRANAVASELVRDGVPQNVISITGYGETHPLVKTADGVREPQNRRVEIILH